LVDSRGVHARTDEECLKNAEAARLVLETLAVRVDGVLKDRAKLAAGLKALLDDDRRSKS
jgi:hypothetical protein